MYRQNLFLKTHSLIGAIQILALLTLLSTSLHAQNLAWAKSAGGSGFDEGLGIAIDGADNSYVTGSFYASATFGLAQANQTTLSGTIDEIFVAKYSHSGALLWAKSAGGSGFDEGMDIAVDVVGNSYVTGIFNVSATFGLGEANQTTLSGPDNEIFVAKYNPNSGLVWAKSAGGASGDGGYSITVDGGGNCYVTGMFTNSATFGAGEANETTLFGAIGIFVAKYNPSGALVWARGASSSQSQGNEIVVDGAGNSYVTGFFHTLTTFGMGEVNQTTLTGERQEIFLAKYDPTGALVWAKSASGPNRDDGQSIRVDGFGNSYVTGIFDESVTFGSGEPNQTTLSGVNSEMFVAKYDLNGALVWAKGAGGVGVDVGYGLDLDGLGNSYITGRFDNSATFGLGEANQTTLSGTGSEIFVAKYNSSGALVWAKGAGGPNNNDIGYDIAIDGFGNSYVTGQFHDSTIFGAGEANQTTLLGTGVEIFVARYGSTLIESFADGNFTSNPTWSGTTSTWQVVTSSDVAAGAPNSNTLRLSAASGSGTKYLSTQRNASWGTEQSWSFWLGRRSESATNTNHSIVWLWANETNLTSSTVDGYRIRFGDNSGGDNIVLQRVTNGSATDILTSSGTVPNGLTDIGFMVRVTRMSSSVWTLYTSTLPPSSGSGAVATAIPTAANTTVKQGSVTNSTYTNFANGYFGFMAVHTSAPNARTSAEFDQLYFDTSSSSPLGKPVFEDVVAEVATSIPQTLQLFQNFPNPFNPTTTILYELPRASQVEVTIFNLLGEKIRTLVNQPQPAGQHQLLWDGRDENEMPVPSGVYFYRMRAGEFVQTQKMILMQ